ncbi:hypothetical protein [Ralstonia sp. GP71]|uniref:hypothetical protein n=1 Tax=Ralstonia sp. GP71 TaxID=3035152 RepID=UPI0038929037
MKKGHRVPQTEKAMAHFASSFFLAPISAAASGKASGDADVQAKKAQRQLGFFPV